MPCRGLITSVRSEGREEDAPRQNYTQHNDIHHNDIHHNDTRHNSKQNATLRIMVDSCFAMSHVITVVHAECRKLALYAECPNAECHL